MTRMPTAMSARKPMFCAIVKLFAAGGGMKLSSAEQIGSNGLLQSQEQASVRAFLAAVV